MTISSTCTCPRCTGSETPHGGTMSNPVAPVRWGAVALAVAGPLFIAYPAVRPWHDENTVAGATQSMSSGAWVAAHFFAMLGFILLPLGLLAVRTAVASTR